MQLSLECNFNINFILNYYIYDLKLIWDTHTSKKSIKYRIVSKVLKSHFNGFLFILVEIDSYLFVTKKKLRCLGEKIYFNVSFIIITLNDFKLTKTIYLTQTVLFIKTYLFDIYMLMIACSGMALAAIMARGGRPRVIMGTIPLQATNNLFINWLLELTLIPRFNQAIMGFSKPFWDLLGHYGFY